MPTSAASLARRLGRPVGGPAYRWLAERIRGEILDGMLLVGERVPSERAVAIATGLSRTTVSAAYVALRAEGFLLSRPGSNTVAALPAAAIARPDQVGGDVRADEIDLTVAALPAPAVLPSLAVEAARDLASFTSGHGLHPMGIAPLRAAVAAHLTASGLPTRDEQVLITQGALHGWDLVLRALTSPGHTVVVEQPSYPGVIDAAAAHFVRVRPLGVTSRGWQLDHVARRSAPTLVHVTPDHQNPTGFNASPADRRALLQAFGDAIVVVDETFADLSFSARQPPLASFGGRTITLGSLSKSVWAGLRVGWLRASPELVRRIAMSRSSQDLSTPVLDQLLALRCLSEFEPMLADRVTMLRSRRDHLLAALAARAPDWTSTVPSGGLMLWVDLGGLSSAELARRGLAHGVRIAPGTRFSASSTHDRFLRLPFSHPPATLDTALERLLQARGELHLSASHPIAAPAWTA